MASFEDPDAVVNSLRDSQFTIITSLDDIVPRDTHALSTSQDKQDDRQHGDGSAHKSTIENHSIAHDDQVDRRSAQTQLVPTTTTTAIDWDPSLHEYLSEAESELTDLSLLDGKDIADTDLDALEDRSTEVTSLPIITRSLAVPPGDQNINIMERDASIESECDPTESGGSSTARPKKRVKTNDNDHKAATSAPTDFLDAESAPALTGDLLTTLSSSSPAHVETSTLSTTQNVTASVDKSLPPLLSSTLPPALEALATTRQQHPFPQPPKFPQSLKMTILPTPEYDTLKSHNSILRSHNMSLANQNAALRIDNARAIQIYEEVKDMGPLDHTTCVHKDDYIQAEAENATLRDDMTKLRYEHQLMKECGFEWARRENLWEVEKQLFQNEVQGLLSKVNDATGKEQEFVRRIVELEHRLKIADQVLGQARMAIRQEKARADALQAQVDHAQALAEAQTAATTSMQPGFGRSTGFYPEL